MPSREPRVEVAGGQRLPLGGLNGYAGVRGKQGRKKDMFQGVTPKKKHRTRHFPTQRRPFLTLGTSYSMNQSLAVIGNYWS